MLTVGSYNLLSRAPAPGKFSGAPLQARKQKAASVALPWVPSKQSRPPLSVCYAQKNTYDMQPFALVHPKFPPTSDGSWRVTEAKDRINLWFYVEPSTSKDMLEVGTEDGVLRIRYRGDSSDDSPASLLDVRLLIPPGYDGNKVEAELALGSLHVTVPKPQRGINEIPISEPNQ